MYDRRLWYIRTIHKYLQKRPKSKNDIQLIPRKHESVKKLKNILGYVMWKKCKIIVMIVF